MKCEHKREWYRPLWRSDLVGDGRHVFNLRHGWWCTGCGSEQVAVDDGVPKIAAGKTQAASWTVRLTSVYEVVVRADGTTGAEAEKLALSIQAAFRKADTAKREQKMREMGRVGWRATETMAGPAVWYWDGIFDNSRVGCLAVGVQTKTKRACHICRCEIDPGQRCWRADKVPWNLHMREIGEGRAQLRFCVKCIASLPREEIGAPTKEMLPPRRGQPDLRLVPRPPPEPPTPGPRSPSPRRRRRRPRRVYTFTVARAA